MNIFRKSLIPRIVAPMVLIAGGVLAFFLWFSMMEVKHSFRVAERDRGRELARAMAWDSRVFLAVQTKDSERALEAAKDLFHLAPSVMRVQIRQVENSKERVLMDARRPGRGEKTPDLEEEMDWEVVRIPIFGEDQGSFGEDSNEGFFFEDGDTGSARSQRKKLGDLTLWMDPSTYAKALSHLNSSFLWFGLIACALSGGAVAFVIRRQLRRLSLLARYTEDLGNSDRCHLDPPTIPESEDEIGRLFQSFLKMEEQLRKSWERIEEQNAGLERTVEKRTQELQAAIEELKGLDRLKDRLLSSVSHEMRTPLTSIHSFAEILLEYGQEESVETQREFLAIIKTESERLSRLITDILDMAKIESGKLRWVKTEFDLRELVLEATRAAKGLRREKNVLFQTDLPKDALLFRGDRDRIQQVLFNLYSNAWKFSPLDGEILARLSKDGDLVVLEVMDRGPGFSGEEEKRRIFERFQQGGEHLTNKTKGTGLGLSISKGIVEMHGGRIFALDRPGGGAIFRVELPMDVPEEPRIVGGAFSSPASR